MKELRDIQNTYKSTILEGLYKETFNGVNLEDVGVAWDLLRAFYDCDVFFSFIYSDNYLFEDLSEEIEDTVTEKVYDMIAEFYNHNALLLDESFTLNNNFYNVNLRLLIVDIESNLREEAKESTGK
jgi:hypothetical protein